MKHQTTLTCAALLSFVYICISLLLFVYICISLLLFVYICISLLLFVYICISCEDPIIKMGRFVILIPSLIPPHFCACPKQGSGFSTSHVMVFFMFNDLRWEVIVRFIDIGGIVDYHCLDFLIIIYNNTY